MTGGFERLKSSWGDRPLYFPGSAGLVRCDVEPVVALCFGWIHPVPQDQTLLGGSSQLVGRLTGGILEGFNRRIQAAKARARGYRTNRNLITMAYLIAGKLNHGLPT